MTRKVDIMADMTRVANYYTDSSRGWASVPLCEFCNAPALDDICESCYLLGRHLVEAK